MIDVGSGVAFLVFASSTGVMAAMAGRMERQSRRTTGNAVRVPGPSVRVLRGSEQLREARERESRRL